MENINNTNIPTTPIISEVSNIPNPSPKSNIFKYLFIISIIVLLTVIISFYLILSNKISKLSSIQSNNNISQTISNTKTNPTKNEAVIYKDFTNSNYTINLVNKVDNISDIYKINVSYANSSSSTSYPNNLKYNLIVHYNNENTLTLATITGPLDYRVLDFSDNKIYFLIKNDDTLFEVNYIDLNNLGAGAIELTGFNNMYKKSSILCLPKGCTPYSTQIFIKNNILYYTEFNQSTNSILKTYNISTSEIKAISNRNIGWYDFYLDKTHNKLFYYSDGTVYISNLDGSNETDLGKDFYSGSGFFSEAIYKNSPIFEVNCKYSKEFSICDLDTFDYEKNVFINIAKDIQNFVVKSDSIVYEAGNNEVINSFYIAK